MTVRRFTPIALLFAIVALPLLALAVLRLRPDDTLAGVTFDAMPVLQQPTPREITDEKPVRITPTWEKGPVLSAPAWSGLVLSVQAQPNTALKSGDRIALIAGIQRLAFASDQPFYRPIASGESGPDVAALHRLLQLTGSMTSVPSNPEQADFATTVAIRQLASTLGLPGTVSTFDPAWVVWLPADPFPLGTLDLHAGGMAPPAGAALGAAQPVLTGAAVAPLNQEPLTLDSAAEWVLTVGQTTVDVSPTALAVDPKALASLAAALPPTTQSAPAAGATGANPSSASGTIRRKTALQVLAVPSQAVQSNLSGALCVWIADGTSYAARPVKLASARAGVSNVSGGIDAHAQVLVNPSAVLERPQCP
jgi:hypothetical protein